MLRPNRGPFPLSTGTLEEALHNYQEYDQLSEQQCRERYEQSIKTVLDVGSLAYLSERTRHAVEVYQKYIDFISRNGFAPTQEEKEQLSNPEGYLSQMMSYVTHAGTILKTMECQGLDFANVLTLLRRYFLNHMPLPEAWVRDPPKGIVIQPYREEDLFKRLDEHRNHSPEAIHEHSLSEILKINTRPEQIRANTPGVSYFKTYSACLRKIMYPSISKLQTNELERLVMNVQYPQELILIGMLLQGETAGELIRSEKMILMFANSHKVLPSYINEIWTLVEPLLTPKLREHFSSLVNLERHLDCLSRYCPCPGELIYVVILYWKLNAQEKGILNELKTFIEQCYRKKDPIEGFEKLFELYVGTACSVRFTNGEFSSKWMNMLNEAVHKLLASYIERCESLLDSDLVMEFTTESNIPSSEEPEPMVEEPEPVLVVEEPVVPVIQPKTKPIPPKKPVPSDNYSDNLLKIRHLFRFLKTNGFTLERQRGTSHSIWSKRGKIVVVPVHTTNKMGLVREIVKTVKETN